MLLKMAWRNLWRNRTRTLIVFSAIGITYALFLVSMGVSDEMYGKMEESAAQMAGGSVLVHADGFWAEQTNDLIIQNPEPLLAELREIPELETAAPRLLLNGLVSTSATSVPIQLQGIDPDIERKVSSMPDHLEDGTFLSGDEESPIVLPTSLAEELKATLGDRIVVTATGPDGEMQRALFHLSGTLDVGEMGAAAGVGFTTLPAARRAVGLDGNELSQIGLVTSMDRAEFKEAVKKQLGERPGLEVLTWSEAIPDLVGFIEMDRSFANIYGVLVFIVVVFSITNTFLMIVMERVRELGLLGAIGMTPWRVGWLVMLETIVLASVALAVGFAIGYSGHLAIATYGIDLSAMYGGSEIELSGVSLTDMTLRSRLDAGRWINATITVFALVVMSALYPAWRAARLAPADAMRFFG